MASQLPTDEELRQGFTVDSTIEFSSMRDQAEEIGKAMARQGPLTRGRERQVTAEAPDSPVKGFVPGATSSASTRKRGGGSDRGRGRGHGRPKEGPKRDNQLGKLTSALSEADTEMNAPIPEGDAITTTEIDNMSARSSRIEEAVEDHSLQIHASGVRISALEHENSCLVSRINLLTTEISKIKEMLAPSRPNPSKTYHPASTLHVPSTIPQAPSDSGSNSSPGGVKVGKGFQTLDSQSHPDLGSRPVPKRKFIG